MTTTDNTASTDDTDNKMLIAGVLMFVGFGVTMCIVTAEIWFFFGREGMELSTNTKGLIIGLTPAIYCLVSIATLLRYRRLLRHWNMLIILPVVALVCCVMIAMPIN